MKVVILAGPTPSTFFAHVALGTALRNAGHQVMVTASSDDVLPSIAAAGLPALPVMEPGATRRQIVADAGLGEVPEDPVERERTAGRWLAIIDTAPMRALLDFAERWHPDVVIGGMQAYGAGVLAARLGVPYVRQAWDIHDPRLMDAGAAEQLAGEPAGPGPGGLPVPDMVIDATPPSLRLPGAAPAQTMRWIPGNSQCRLERWMYTRGAEHRIGVTIGTTVADYDQYDYLEGIVSGLSELDAEVAVAVPEEAAPETRERLPGAHVGWIPLDVLAPTCDVLVHQSGGNTMLTALSAGTPQVLVPDPGQFRQTEMARRVAEAGAGIVPPAEEAVGEAVAKACRRVISDPGYAAAAAGLRREMEALASPSEVVRRIEGLVRQRHRDGRGGSLR